ncbi:MAG: dienelactone hydrolase family protein [Trueperaceae bacterium]|nr:dienelactone hydrolase family protein [Trueperaceae bacterium]
MSTTDLHRPNIVASTGADLQDATVAVVMIHGRGDSGRGILGLSQYLPSLDSLAYVAPQATRNTWYPYSFLQPMENNEPWLSSALETVGAVVKQVKDAGVPSEKTVLLGFSQGACLASEYAARHAKRYGGIVALSGGLIGPDGTPRHYDGDLAGTPALFGCSDIDPHIPAERVHESAEVYTRLGADVDKRIYPNFGHSVNDDELDYVRTLLTELAGG